MIIPSQPWLVSLLLTSSVAARFPLNSRAVCTNDECSKAALQHPSQAGAFCKSFERQQTDSIVRGHGDSCPLPAFVPYPDCLSPCFEDQDFVPRLKAACDCIAGGTGSMNKLSISSIVGSKTQASGEFSASGSGTQATPIPASFNSGSGSLYNSQLPGSGLYTSSHEQGQHSTGTYVQTTQNGLPKYSVLPGEPSATCSIITTDMSVLYPIWSRCDADLCNLI